MRAEFDKSERRLLELEARIDKNTSEVAKELALIDTHTSLRDFLEHSEYISETARGYLFCSVCSDKSKLITDDRLVSSSWVIRSLRFKTDPAKIDNTHNSL